ncbi:hypothetical protein QVD99_006138 [Batrachochytrium dendrobatidis]|nr:hypothetical protein O5D80_003872 [Batrachochytrium dendrobatidis]KAK5666916.1 hypothetical protein QVD99_006138 [Batrachochytrium dendrobatidis]
MPKPTSPTKSVVAKKTCSDLASKVEKAVHAFNLWCQQCLHGDAAAHDKFAHAIKSFSTDWKCVFASGDKAEYSGIKDWFNYDLKVANDPLAKCHSSNFETIWENQDAILLSYDSEWSKKGVPTHTIYSAMWIKDKDAPHGVKCVYWSESQQKKTECTAVDLQEHSKEDKKRQAEEHAQPKSPKKTK